MVRPNIMMYSDIHQQILEFRGDIAVVPSSGHLTSWLHRVGPALKCNVLDLFEPEVFQHLKCWDLIFVNVPIANDEARPNPQYSNPGYGCLQ
jgi:hypothetical protein